MEQSKKWSLNKADWKKWFNSAIEWLAPVALTYLGFVAINLQDGFSTGDFIPTNAVIGVASLYVVNQLYGLFKRAKAGTK